MPERTISAMNAAVYTVNARVNANSSGINTQPPTKLKPCSFGASQCTGGPNSRQLRAGMIKNSARPTQNLWNGTPVSSKRLVAQRLISTIAAMATTTLPTNGQKPSVVRAAGMFRPRLLTKKVSKKLWLWRGPGMVRKTAKYQNRICSKGGMLRKISTYTVASLLMIQFDDSRATPTMKPRMVARMTPIKVTNRVLSKPMTNTRA
ncbi:hypothetical protein D9M71_396640 [compost metagenome]